MKRNATETEYRDSKGLPFANIRAAFCVMGVNPQSIKPGIVKNRKLLSDMHAEASTCWLCRVPLNRSWNSTCELHHLIHGKSGRSDERTNILILCRQCHGMAHSAKFLKGEQLYILWLFARESVDWLRICVLQRAYLPDLIVTRREQ